MIVLLHRLVVFPNGFSACSWLLLALNRYRTDLGLNRHI